MRSPLASTIGTVERCVAISVLASALASCTVSGLITEAAPIAVPLAAMALDGKPSDTGPMTAYLTDGRVLEGNWDFVTREVPAEGVFVVTPEGEVTARQLATPHLPVITATLVDAHSRMVCAFFGDRESRYSSRCADDNGKRWFGSVSHDSALGPTSRYPFRGHVSVALYERRR